MPNLLLFGLGYSGARIKAALEEEGWTVTGIRRQAAGDVIGFDDAASVRAAIAGATHILSSVPPAEGADPVLALYGGDLRSEEHTSELQSLMRISYAGFCLKN